LSLFLMAILGATDTIWAAARGTILQLTTPDGFRGRVMGVFQLSNRGLHPLGQVQSGLVIPIIGAPAATVAGGLLASAVTFFIAWKVPAIRQFRWERPFATPQQKKDIAA
jgi:hypothetical protein